MRIILFSAILITQSLEVGSVPGDPAEVITRSGGQRSRPRERSGSTSSSAASRDGGASDPSPGCGERDSGQHSSYLGTGTFRQACTCQNKTKSNVIQIGGLQVGNMHSFDVNSCESRLSYRYNTNMQVALLSSVYLICLLFPFFFSLVIEVCDVSLSGTYIWGFG